jgi:guanylate kinase
MKEASDNMNIIAKPKEDFTGMKFGRLTVVCRADDYVFPNGTGRAAKWHCVCECGNEVDVRHDKLKNGSTKSCGCFCKELASTLIQNAIDSCRRPLKTNPTLQLNLTQEGYVPFGMFKCDNDRTVDVLFSMQDYDTIKDSCWFIQWVNDGQYCRVKTVHNNKTLAMHRLFGMYDADHINRNALDNRRENLNPQATRSDQNHNHKIRRDNKTGVRGLGYNEKCVNKPWRAQCRHDNEIVLDKYFHDRDEAIIAILKTEIKYYPENSWQKNLMYKYKLIQGDDQLKPLICLVGKSASGKTTVANILEEGHEYKQLQSYTTRPPRYENETGHTFISDEEFDQLKDVVAYTEYNGYKYGSTKQQIDDVEIYVIDVPGIETLLEKYNTERPIRVFYFDTTVRSRIERMLNRHDSDTAIVSRLYNDEASDWENDLNKLVWHYKNNVGKDVEMYKINADENIYNVLMQVKNHIEEKAVDENDNCM